MHSCTHTHTHTVYSAKIWHCLPVRLVWCKIRLQRVKFNKTKIRHKHELRLCFEFVRYTKKVQVVVDKQAAVWNGMWKVQLHVWQLHFHNLYIRSHLIALSVSMYIVYGMCIRVGQFCKNSFGNFFNWFWSKTTLGQKKLHCCRTSVHSNPNGFE